MKIYILIFIVLLISSVSAISLTSNIDNLNISKTVGQIYTTNFTINNPTSYTFYNLSFENNNYVTSTLIPSLAPGQSVNINIQIITDEDVNLPLNFKGFYMATVGDSNKIYEINMNKSLTSNCDFSIIKNEKIKWKNLEIVSTYNPMKIIGNYLGVNFNNNLAANEEYTYQFTQSGEFDYLISYNVPYFQKSCKLNILSDIGYVNNPELDAIINFNINNLYPSTLIQSTFFDDNFSMNFYDTRDGFFILKNIGTNVAKNVKINADWMSFSSLNKDLSKLDIAPGEQVNIFFNIKPKINNTNDTDKNYIKPIKITGNFDEINKDISIFINYAEINPEDINGTNAGLIEFITKFCNENPDICNTEPRIIYKNINESDTYFNATLGVNQLKALFMAVVDSIDRNDQQFNYFKEQFLNMTSEMTNIKSNTELTKDSIQDVIKEISEANGVWIFIGFFGFAILICGGLVYILIYYKRKNKLEDLGKY